MAASAIPSSCAASSICLVSFWTSSSHIQDGIDVSKVSGDGIFSASTQQAVEWIERLRGDIGSQHLGEFVILETSFEELLLSKAAVVVFVHPGI